MFKFVGRRLVYLVVTLVAVSFLTFSMIHLLPGDAVTYMLGGQSVTPEQVAALRGQLGLDLPFMQQYLRFLAGALHGDLGNSLVSGQSAMSAMAPAIWATVRLAGISMAGALLVGVALAVISGTRPGSRMDRVVSAITVLGFSVPDFFVGLLLILFVSGMIPGLPTVGMSGPASFILPATTLGLVPLALITRITRSSIADTMTEDFVTFARSRGFSATYVSVFHVLPKSLIPTVTIGGILLGTMIGRAVVVELVFAWPGIGRMLITAIQSRDIPLVQGIVLLIAIAFVLINLCVDLLYHWLDPRVRGKLG
jgi:ABC-type dipeptide/oligopeptide/nickel transport system permease component